MEEGIENLSLYDEDGNELKFQVITKIDIEEREYVIVIPEDELDAEEAIALRIEQDEDGNDILVTVEDEDELEEVSIAYEESFKDKPLN